MLLLTKIYPKILTNNSIAPILQQYKFSPHNFIINIWPKMGSAQILNFRQVQIYSKLFRCQITQFKIFLKSRSDQENLIFSFWPSINLKGAFVTNFKRLPLAHMEKYINSKASNPNTALML